MANILVQLLRYITKVVQDARVAIAEKTIARLLKNRTGHSTQKTLSWSAGIAFIEAQRIEWNNNLLLYI